MNKSKALVPTLYWCPAGYNPTIEVISHWALATQGKKGRGNPGHAVHV
ncbi:Hypothetical protein DHA2_151943 [Giardia duodenalis]|uniref:Uncharacterized protein n=1 Tax=Giardia intestinalis TaxID=5741 RepID=V6TC06_GIAIN|nr:Hypothetical protein DHA2_151943 [Giardia intestinalis]